MVRPSATDGSVDARLSAQRGPENLCDRPWKNVTKSVEPGDFADKQFRLAGPKTKSLAMRLQATTDVRWQSGPKSQIHK
jgi:hypothetical protein